MQVKVLQNAPREHSAIFLSFIKLPFIIKIFVLSIFEWPLKTGFTVYLLLVSRKACNDVLELVEDSFDLDLYGSRVRFHFEDTAILEGVSIHEAQGHVVVLVPTVASVHRLVFPHPSKLQRTV